MRNCTILRTSQSRSSAPSSSVMPTRTSRPGADRAGDAAVDRRRSPRGRAARAPSSPLSPSPPCARPRPPCRTSNTTVVIVCGSRADRHVRPARELAAAAAALQVGRTGAREHLAFVHAGMEVAALGGVAAAAPSPCARRRARSWPGAGAVSARRGARRRAQRNHRHRGGIGGEVAQFPARRAGRILVHRHACASSGAFVHLRKRLPAAQRRAPAAASARQGTRREAAMVGAMEAVR